LSILLKSRNSAEVIIVDTVAERIDDEIFYHCVGVQRHRRLHKLTNPPKVNP
jgi:hypothetical protein